LTTTSPDGLLLLLLWVVLESMPQVLEQSAQVMPVGVFGQACGHIQVGDVPCL